MSRASPQRIAAIVVAGQRRVAVPVVERVAAEPARLQPVIAMRQFVVGAADGATIASTTSSSTLLERLR